MNDAHEAEGRYAGWSLAAALADIDLRLRFVEATIAYPLVTVDASVDVAPSGNRQWREEQR